MSTRKGTSESDADSGPASLTMLVSDGAEAVTIPG